MIKRIILIIALVLSNVHIVVADNEMLESFSTSLERLWQEKSCSSSFNTNTNYDIISLACEGNYSYRDRLTFLDFAFKNHLQMEKEDHRIDKTDGFYLYKFFRSNNPKPFFIKLYFRSANVLWPNHLGKVRVAFFVNHIESSRQVIEWKKLGIKINYIVNPFTADSQKISQQVKSYGQSLWVNLPYQNNNNNNTQTLTIETAANKQALDQYLNQVFLSIPQPDGFLTGGGNYFSFNTFAVRNLIKNLKERKVPLILDENKKERISYATAQILGQKSYWVDFVVNEKNITQVWQTLKRKTATDNNLVIILAQANSQFVYNFIEKQITNDVFEFILLPSTTLEKN